MECHAAAIVPGLELAILKYPLQLYELKLMFVGRHLISQAGWNRCNHIYLFIMHTQSMDYKDCHMCNNIN